jgi:hypothetical protein
MAPRDGWEFTAGGRVRGRFDQGLDFAGRLRYRMRSRFGASAFGRKEVKL